MGNSLINLGDFLQPVNTLLEKIADAVGVLYEPTRIERKAKAEAKAKIIMAKADIENDDLQRRAARRFIAEETIKQQNMESIIEKAIPDIKDDAKPENMQNDWLFNFFDKARMFSDEDMQVLWAKILAGEANAPGSFSKTTLRILAEIEKSDAVLFTNLCTFCFNLYEKDECLGTFVIVKDYGNSIYMSRGITLNRLYHLNKLGLLTFEDFLVKSIDNVQTFSYFDTIYKIKNHVKKSLPIGNAIFSEAGEQLSRICSPQKDEKVLEYVINCWKQEGYEVDML